MNKNVFNPLQKQSNERVGSLRAGGRGFQTPERKKNESPWTKQMSQFVSWNEQLQSASWSQVLPTTSGRQQDNKHSVNNKDNKDNKQDNKDNKDRIISRIISTVLKHEWHNVDKQWNSQGSNRLRICDITNIIVEHSLTVDYFCWERTIQINFEVSLKDRRFSVYFYSLVGI